MLQEILEVLVPENFKLTTEFLEADGENNSVSALSEYLKHILSSPLPLLMVLLKEVFVDEPTFSEVGRFVGVPDFW